MTANAWIKDRCQWRLSLFDDEGPPMLTHRHVTDQIEDEIESLQKAIKIRDLARIEEHALTLLEAEQELPNPDCNRLKKTTIVLVQALLKQERFDEVLLLLDESLKLLQAHNDCVDLSTGILYHMMANASARAGEMLSALQQFSHSILVLRLTSGDHAKETKEAIADFQSLAGKLKKHSQGRDLRFREETIELLREIDKLEDAVSKPPPSARPAGLEEAIDSLVAKLSNNYDERYCGFVPPETEERHFHRPARIILKRADAIRDEAAQMINDLVEPGLTWAVANESGRAEELEKALRVFSRFPPRFPAILAKFEQAIAMYQEGLDLLENAVSPVDSKVIIFWYGHLANVYVNIGKEHLAAEIVNNFPQ